VGPCAKMHNGCRACLLLPFHVVPRHGRHNSPGSLDQGRTSYEVAIGRPKSCPGPDPAPVIGCAGP
jgi:hypothetical protein